MKKDDPNKSVPEIKLALDEIKSLVISEFLCLALVALVALHYWYNYYTSNFDIALGLWGLSLFMLSIARLSAVRSINKNLKIVYKYFNMR
jgi:hypothetical protein